MTVLPLQHKLFRFAASILKNSGDPEDVVQDVLVKLWELRGELSKYNNIEAFAMKITKNRCLDKLKQTRRTSELSDNDLNTESDSRHRQIEIRNTVDLAHKFIEQLPYMQQTVIRLRDVEGYELDEIAEILEISASAVRTNLSRARQTVREKLYKCMNHQSMIGY
jgi:RNA polymerase sigma-70 factor (ECF subfamily)